MSPLVRVPTGWGGKCVTHLIDSRKLILYLSKEQRALGADEYFGELSPETRDWWDNCVSRTAVAHCLSFDE